MRDIDDKFVETRIPEIDLFCLEIQCLWDSVGETLNFHQFFVSEYVGLPTYSHIKLAGIS